MEEDGKPPRMVPLADIARVHLQFTPTRFERNIYRCRLRLRNGATLDLFNRTFEGFAAFRDTSAGYVAFVRQLHAALTQHAPACKFVAGNSTVSYLVNVLATIFVGVMLGIASMLLYAVGLRWMIVVKLLIICFYLPTLFRWIRRNQPRRYRPLEIPADVLPVLSTNL